MMLVKSTDSIEYRAEQVKQMNDLYKNMPDETRNTTISILDIFNKSYKEDEISNYLAYILDPSKNGLGTQPLKNIVDFGKGKWETSYDEHVDKIKVMREFVLINQRRVDLVINVNDSLIIGIENKVFTEEHGKQTIDYAEKLKKKFPEYKYVFLFLSPNGRIPLSPEFMAMSYGDLHDVLKSIRYDSSRDIRKTIIFEDFINHLEEKFMKNGTLQLSDKTKLYIDNAKMMEDLRNSLEKDYKRVLENIMKMIQNRIETFTGEPWELNTNENRNWHQISKRAWKRKGLDIHVEVRMSPSNLAIDQTIELAIDIESQEKKIFIEKFEKNYITEIENLILKSGLDKNRRAITYVSKNYKLLTKDLLDNPTELQEKIEAMVDDFLPFIEMIDVTLL
jgi:hypothetical protein